MNDEVREQKPKRGPGKPRAVPIRTVDIVHWLQKAHAEEFRIADILRQYAMKRGEAQRRVQYMIVYQLARRLGPIKTEEPGRREVAYSLTDWGKRYTGVGRKIKKIEGEPRATANPKNRGR